MHETRERGKMEGVANEGLSTDGFGGTRGVSQPPRLRFSARVNYISPQTGTGFSGAGAVEPLLRVVDFKFSGMFGV